MIDTHNTVKLIDICHSVEMINADFQKSSIHSASDVDMLDMDVFEVMKGNPNSPLAVMVK